MKKIDSYLIKNLLLSFAGSVFALTLILLVNTVFQLMDLLIRKGVPFPTVVKLIAYTLPFIMNMTIPMSFLVAGLLTFGRSAGNNEILCLRSSGIDLKVVLNKLGLIMVIIAFLNLIFNLFILPETNYRMKKTLYEIRIKKPAIEIEPGYFNKIENYLIYAASKDEKTSILKDVKIQEIKRDGVRFISAKEGKIRSTTGGSLILELLNGEFLEVKGEKKEQLRRASFKKDVLVLKVEEGSFYRDVVYRSDREKNYFTLLKEIRDARKELVNYPKNDKISRNFVRRRINTILAEINTRFALSFASIVFVFLAFPIALRFKFSGYGSALGVSFFFFIIYYILLLAGQQTARRSLFNPYIALWTPNLIFGMFSFVLTKKELEK
ncbi:MAG: LptF/LptG family permease [bacterium]|nr:LptF/LptG family permease [bacterium]